MTTSLDRTILIPLNGSQRAAMAIPFGTVLSAQLHARPIVLYVAPSPMGIREARRKVGLAGPGTRGLGLRLRTGAVADKILAELDRPEVELLVMAAGSTHENRGLGSVARRVAILATKPVVFLPVGIGEDRAKAAAPFSRLLVPLDGSRSTAAALRPVMLLSRRMEASIDVVYVAVPGAEAEEEGSMTGPRYVDQAYHEWSSWAEELKERLRAECRSHWMGADAGVYLRRGDPGMEIVRLAREERYDAIALVRKCEFEAGRGAVLESVISQAPCPVFLVGGAR